MDRSTEFAIFVENCVSNQSQPAQVYRKDDILQNKFNNLANALRDSLTNLQNSIDELSPLLSNPNNFLQKPKPKEILHQDRSDHETQKCIQNCHKMIMEYLDSLNTTEINSPQVKLYFSNTIYLIEHKLGQQIDTYTKMRSQRYEQLQRVKNAFRLSSHLNKSGTFDGEDDSNIHHSTNPNCANVRQRQNNTISEISNLPLDEIEGSNKEEMRLEQENRQLVHEMKTEFDEIKSIQTKLHEISQLQHIFAEEVLKQKEEVTVIADMTVESALNITEGNKHIRKAIQKQFTSDGIVLFIIVMFTIALWFLDWYQD
ncbi:syntaxin-18 [Oopsacas minuta]|uniref:Syntaxin-18 n=1 Tax=Oopsacas minuta TaxID=111878 RepID=A0AAV7K432_9METZ|nr:syntaxin-18 [Oopsacas minuta]